jgi:aspartate/methionine/tyrosine aminotransferase
VHYYSDRVLAAPPAELRAVAGLGEPVGPGAIDLTAGTPRLDPVAANFRPTVDWRTLPPPAGLPELRTAIAEKLNGEQNLGLQPADEVLVTHGAAGAFGAALEAVVNPGDGVALFDPASPLHVLMLRQRRARPRWVRTWNENGRCRFHLEHLVKALRWSRLLVVTSPANPTGSVLAAEDLEQIVWWAERRDVLILSDEVFERFCLDAARPGFGSWPRARPRLLLAGSVSKGHGLAAARVGWLAGQRHLIRPCVVTANLQAPFVSPLCQQAALHALQQAGDGFEGLAAELRARRQYGRERLQAMGLQPGWPAGAFFFWVPVAPLGLSGWRFAELLQRKQAVRVCPGELFGPSGAGHVRLSFAVEDGRLREGLSRLAEFVRTLSGAGVAPTERQRQAA